MQEPGVASERARECTFRSPLADDVPAHRDTRRCMSCCSGSSSGWPGRAWAGLMSTFPSLSLVVLVVTYLEAGPDRVEPGRPGLAMREFEHAGVPGGFSARVPASGGRVGDGRGLWCGGGGAAGYPALDELDRVWSGRRARSLIRAACLGESCGEMQPKRLPWLEGAARSVAAELTFERSRDIAFDRGWRSDAALRRWSRRWRGERTGDGPQ